jgi:nickel superoxide dismutase
MNLADRALAAFERSFPAEEASAHCDIPCGIYDPHQAQIAAHTVIRMFQLIQDLPRPDPANASDEQMNTFLNSMGRYVSVKEEHAQLCKEEVLILWTDYFKPEHLEKFPELHDLVWQTTKLCGKAKQEMNPQTVQEMLGNVQRIAEIFWATKGAQTGRRPSLEPSGGEIVYPIPQ